MNESGKERRPSRRLARLARRYDGHRWISAFAALFAVYACMAIVFASAGRPPSWMGLLFGVAYVLAVAMLPMVPDLSAVVLLAAWIVSPLAPDLPIPANPEYAALFALGSATFLNAWHGAAEACGTLAVQAVIQYGYAVDAVGPWHSAMSGFVVPVIQLGGAVLAGAAMRWRTQRQAAETALEQSRLREHTAADIHDSISNKLAFLITQMDMHLDNGTPIGTDELRQLRAATNEAYECCHAVIRDLGPRADVTTPDAADAAGSVPAIVGDMIAAADGDSAESWCADIAVRLEQGDGSLRRCGFDGVSIAPEPRLAVAPAPPVRRAVAALLDEIYANIAKHADAAEPYIVSVAANASGVVVSCADTPLRGGRLAASGTGLERRRHELERLGGTLTIQAAPGSWTLEATLPLRMPAGGSMPADTATSSAAGSRLADQRIR